MKLFAGRRRSADDALALPRAAFTPVDNHRGERGSHSARWIEIDGTVHYLRHRGECRKYRLVFRYGTVWRVSCVKECRWRGWHYGPHESATGCKWSLADGQWEP
jgi:hypothetical protein